MDENYYVFNVKVRENLTDTRAVERMIKNDPNSKVILKTLE